MKDSIRESSYYYDILRGFLGVAEHLHLLWAVTTKDLVYVIVGKDNNRFEVYCFDGENDNAYSTILYQNILGHSSKDALKWLVGDLKINEISHGDVCRINSIYKYSNTDRQFKKTHVH